jgi:two-component system sensor histidine kinase BaeS
VTDAVGSFEAAAAGAGVTLRVDVPDDLPILEVDPVRIREVVANLVANAIRHTPRGGTVTVSGGVEGGGTARRVEVTVSDTGRGIDPALLPHVFDRFAKSATRAGRAWGWRSPAGSSRPTAGRSPPRARPAPAPRSGSRCPVDRGA